MSGQSFVDAYPGGLLNGKPLTSDKGNKVFTMTDGDLNTSGTLSIYSGGAQSYSYDFVQPVDIDAYQIKAYSAKLQYTEIEFIYLDDKGFRQRFNIPWAKMQGDKQVLSAPLKNVMSVSIKIGFSEIINVYEFDVFGKVNDTTPPAVPVGLVAKAGLRDAELNWTPNTDLDIKSYYVYVDGKRVAIVNHPDTKYIVKGLTPGTRYTFELSAVDLSDNESKKVMTQAMTIPLLAKPELKIGKVTFDSIELYWAKTGINYVLYKDGQKLLDLQGDRHVISGLKADTEYIFKLHVTDALGQQATSDDLKVKTKSIPKPATLILSSQSVKHNEARLIWNDIGSSSYTLYRNGSKYQDVKGNFFQEYSLNPETAYEYQLVAKDALGREIKSNVVKFRTLVAPKPKPPPPPPPPPPKCADSKNADLNSATDYLCQGANDAKDESLLIIAVAVMLLIIVFGTLWLLKVYKKKMTSSVSSSSR
ncbi:fibronectin type III domain-containing protein [Paenibacillus alvei]|uniref:fibronectin type III domain-containing protein n=1 Tax=Paenibacillus alvei TaxID=44250 RepID=UPI002282AA4F|nr:hypothetical protein [Paenibacillus alvei]MCY7488067.1 hypothetical protein [Paenibacillus alvei]